MNSRQYPTIRPCIAGLVDRQRPFQTLQAPGSNFASLPRCHEAPMCARYTSNPREFEEGLLKKQQWGPMADNIFFVSKHRQMM